MAISRIKTDGIQDDAVTQPKIKDNITLDGTEFVKVPAGTTAQRPSSAAGGQLRFNTTIGTLEQYNTATNSWQAIDSPPIITSLAYAGSITGADPAGGETITLTGTNFKSGATVTIGGTTAPSISVVSSTSITFTTPAKTAADYNVVVTNTNGLSATLTDGISYNGVPAFSTAAGNVGSISGGSAMSTITIVAAEPDGGTLAYSVTSGALPTGVTLGSANGQLTGTPNVNITSDTTFNFTVTATDDENQTNARAFNLIVLRPVYALQIAKSCRFDSARTTKLSRTPSSASNRRKFTFSFWAKRTKISNGDNALFGVQTDGNNRVYIRWEPDDTLKVYFAIGGTAYDNGTTIKFRDIAAWYHIVIAVDMDGSGNTGKLKIYVNGTNQTLTYNSTLPASDTAMNSTSSHTIGKKDGANSFLDGYLSDVHFIDGQQLTPTSFAEEYNGVWAPKAFSGSYGTNGYQLKFGTASALGDDTSGQTNDWTSSGLIVSDSMPDSPTNNFATLNPLDSYNTGGVFTEGNLKWTIGGADGAARSTHVMNSGKWYVEFLSNNDYIGVVSGNASIINMSGSQTVYYAQDGTKRVNGSGSSYGTAYPDGAFIGIALDLDASPQTVIFYKDGVAQPTLNLTDVGNEGYSVSCGSGSGSTNATANFGQDSNFGTNADGNGIGKFKYAVPSGYLALCSKNLGTNSILNIETDDRPEDYFDTILYQASTSNGTHTHGSISFQADLAWIKCRDAGEKYFIIDSVRGNQGITDKFLPVNMNPEGTNGVSGTTFTQTATGYQFVESSISSGELYYNNRTYVGWNWKAGGAPTADNSAGQGAVPTAGSSKVDGSNRTAAYTGITSPKRQTVNTKAGFSITRYTGNATGGGAANSVDHGFSVQPEMIWFKGVTGTKNWAVYNKYLSDDNSYFLYLNGNDDEITTSSDMWNGLSPTNSVVHMGYENTVNENNVDYMMYAWHSVEGYSKIGKYIGTGALDGAFVHCGFKPAFVMVKRIGTSGDGSWFMLDNKRSPNNQVVISLSQGTPNDVTDSNFMDFTANGFKLRTAGGSVNAGGNPYAFMAFAEDPLKYAEAR